MDTYNFQKIENHWQRVWDREATLNVQENTDKPKAYILDMFPGPSGPLHMGHVKNYGIGDVVARYHRRKGYTVFRPIGWDAFGLPAEIAAIKHGVHPREWTDKHIAIQKQQFKSLGIYNDWSAEINTSDSAYYKWNQWLFLKLYEHGLAYQAERSVNWCPQCQTTLANEEVVENACERCDTAIVEKPLQQWFLKITAYAEALLNGLDDLPNWPDRLKTMQRHWIGRSEGADGHVTYHMRDWCISRQRYWGTPIPIIHCKTCGTVPVPESDLPVRLPNMTDFAPDGQPPLSRATNFVNTPCPKCEQPAKRECDTMTGFVCSSWYFLRYTSPHNHKQMFDPKAVKKWLPVTTYIGGKEHSVGHLMYARFICHFLHDLGLIHFTEPVTHLFTQGVVGKDGSKMSKSRGNVVSIENMVTQYGADTARMFILFATPPDRDMEWSDEGVAGIHRFLHRVWRTMSDSQSSPQNQTTDENLTRIMHQTIQAVTKDIERWQHNTAISRLMELTHAIQQTQSEDRGNTQEACEILVSLIAPFAPHMAETLWQKLGHTTSVHRSPWPNYDPQLTRQKTMEIAIQINGKKRDTITVPRTSVEPDIVHKAQTSQGIINALIDHSIQRIIYVPNRLVNFVTKRQ